jgi:hypothetical protein
MSAIPGKYEDESTSRVLQARYKVMRSIKELKDEVEQAKLVVLRLKEKARLLEINLEKKKPGK